MASSNDLDSDFTPEQAKKYSFEKYMSEISAQGIDPRFSRRPEGLANLPPAQKVDALRAYLREQRRHLSEYVSGQRLPWALVEFHVVKMLTDETLKTLEEISVALGEQGASVGSNNNKKAKTEKEGE